MAEALEEGIWELGCSISLDGDVSWDRAELDWLKFMIEDDSSDEWEILDDNTAEMLDEIRLVDKPSVELISPNDKETIVEVKVLITFVLWNSEKLVDVPSELNSPDDFDAELPLIPGFTEDPAFEEFISEFERIRSCCVLLVDDIMIKPWLEELEYAELSVMALEMPLSKLVREAGGNRDTLLEIEDGRIKVINESERKAENSEEYATLLDT